MTEPRHPSSLADALASYLRRSGFAKRIQQVSRDALQIQQGALYPALYRLEHQGLIDSEWGTSDNNRRAKFYRLTAAGRKRLGEETASWSRLIDAVALVLAAKPQEVQ